MTKLDELKRLEAGATPGRWLHVNHGEYIEASDLKNEPIIVNGNPKYNKNAYNDCAFISAAKNAMPALLRVVEAIKPLVDEWKDQSVIDDEVYRKRKAVVDALRDLEGK